MAADLSGAVSLNRAISAECHLGIEDLPFKVGQTFPDDIKTFLQQSLIERRCWLVLVRTAREVIKILEFKMNSLIQNHICVNGSVCNKANKHKVSV